MSPPLPPDADATLRVLRERYRTASVGTPARFETIACRLAGTPQSLEALAELQRELHRVRGTAGSYGFMDVSELAGVLEARVARWSADPVLDREARAAVIEEFVVALRHCFERPDAPPEAPPDAAGASRSAGE